VISCAVLVALGVTEEGRRRFPVECLRSENPGNAIEIDRVAGDALRECFDEDLSIDRPTPEPMRRKVLMRDGHRCTNPHCERSAEHCHHIHFRSRGGPTIPENLTSVCGRCHALIHQGALTVIGRAIAYGEGLVWTTHGDTLLADLRATAKKADNLSIFKLVSGYTDSSGRTDLSRRTDSSGRLDGSHLERSGAVERDVAGSGVSGNVASASGRTDGADFDLPLLSTALTRLGFPKKQSLEVVHRAFEMLDPAEKSEAAILEAALQLRTRTRR